MSDRPNDPSASLSFLPNINSNLADRVQICCSATQSKRKEAFSLSSSGQRLKEEVIRNLIN